MYGMFFGVIVAMLLTAAAAGAGLALLRIVGVASSLRRRELWPLAMGLGTGVLGWLVFFPGVAGALNRTTLTVILIAGLAGWLAVAGLPAPDEKAPPEEESASDRRLFALLFLPLAAILLFDLLPAFAPPVDADTSAYHFALPKQFLAAGRIEFVPRAVEGCPPLLLHMTYALALGLGGEVALTLWVAVLGWVPALMLYTTARRFVSRAWALLLMLLFLSTPAVVYSAHSGHMEVKLAAFALAAAIFAADCVRTGDARYAWVAGLAAGFFFAAKYNGLHFVVGAGLVLICLSMRPRSVLAYSVAVLIGSWQWYAWNYLNSGDPLFPLLYDWLGAKAGLWSPETMAAFKAWNAIEATPVPPNLFWFFAYPFVATFQGLPYWESGRTGLGPFVLLLLPFALLAIWWRRPIRHPLVTVGAIALAFYALWFLSGVSQRVRHLVPIYPLIVLCLGVAAAHFVQWSSHRAALIVGLALTLALQLGGQSLFALNYLRHWTSGESRAAFLERNVARYTPVPWINAHLSKNNRLLLTERQLVYHIEIPTYTAQPPFQHLVNLLPGGSTPRQFLGELNRLGITHILLVPSLEDARNGKRHIWNDELAAYTVALADAGCARVVHSTQTTAMTSRTIPTFEIATVSADVVVIDSTCPLDRLRGEG
jgi:hypothetical protein